jgi:aminoglycoside phosphotransferase (APT) family kinase protein
VDRDAKQPLDPRSIDGLAQAVGARVDTVTTSFGDASSTWHLVLGDGRAVAARRIDHPDGGIAAHRLVTITNRLAEHHIPVAAPATAHKIGDSWWLLTPWIEGRSGRDDLAAPDTAVRLAKSMGELAARLREIPPGAVGTSPAAVGAFAGDGLRSSVISRWKAALGEVEAGLPVHAQNVIRTRLAQLSTIGDWDPVVAHGDFAPVNVVLDDAGHIAALLDLDRVGPGPPETDVAWWGWVVRHHHPEVWWASMPTFLEAAGADTESVARERRAALVLAALTWATARGSDAGNQGPWLARLVAATDWGGDVG